MPYRKVKLPKEVPCEVCGKLHPRKINRPRCRSCGSKIFWLGRNRASYIANGYTVIFIPRGNPYFNMARPTCSEGGRIFEHRLKMAEYLGRPLEKKELVHHLNGIRNDNRNENLTLIKGRENHEGKTLIKALRARILELEFNLSVPMMPSDSSVQV